MHFCILHRNSRWPPKVVGKRFLLIVVSRPKILLKSLYFAPFHVFLRFLQKFKMAAKSDGKVIFVKSRQCTLDTLGVENFNKIALSRTVKEIEANLRFCIFGENSKIQNGRHFWGEEIFLKNAKSSLLRYTVDRKCRRNHSISHGYRDRSKLVFLYFLITCGSKISTKSLYLAQFRR